MLVHFHELRIGDRFETYGDSHSNYDYPKICTCFKVAKDRAEEIDGISFFIHPNDVVDAPEKQENEEDDEE